ncbi:hypothetical protein PENSPDRAFT_755413 [Peniophora sp. CONT]|nr:hypothetical protein PENSPDRAFT_755413 [Peniophora sp. CONT]
MEQDARNELDAFRDQWLAEVQQQTGATQPILARDALSRQREDIDISLSGLSIAAISTLPEDVIREIFYAVASSEPARGTILRYDIDLAFAHTKGLAWMRLAHVCRSWRTTLLGMSDLWGRVAFTFPSPAAAPIILDRAQEADVYIVSKLNVQERQRVDEEAAYLPRARALVIASRPNRRLLAYLTLRPMTRLRYLHLRLNVTDRAGEWAVPGNAEVLDLAEAMRIKEDVHIDAAGLETASFEFRREQSSVGVTPAPALRLHARGLRSLRLRIDDYATPHTRPLGWVVSLLRASPLLESLSLSLSLQSATFDWNAALGETPIQLTHLKRLTLEDSSGTYHSDTLSRICASAPPFLFASFGTFRGATIKTAAKDQMLARALEFARSCGSHLCRPGHHALRVQMPKYNNLTAESMPTLDNPSAFVLREGPSKNADPFTVISELTGAVILNIATPFVRQLTRHEWFGTLVDHITDKHQIEQLCLQCRFKHGDARWIELCRERLLRPMTALHTLYLTHGDPFTYELPCWQSLFQLICSTTGPILPALHTLLVRMQINAVFGLEELGNELDKWFIGLASVLSQRRASGGAVRLLRIVGWWASDEIRCSMKERTDRQLAQVAEFVDNVVDERGLSP